MVDGAVGNNSKWTAGIIILVDEILNGLTKDTNSYYLCMKLWSLVCDSRRNGRNFPRSETILLQISSRYNYWRNWPYNARYRLSL